MKKNALIFAAVQTLALSLTTCGGEVICFICSAYCLSARSGTETLRLMICSRDQKKLLRVSAKTA